MVYGLPEIEEMKESWEGCAMEKQQREPLPTSQALKATEPLKLIHIDVWSNENCNTWRE